MLVGVGVRVVTTALVRFTASVKYLRTIHLVMYVSIIL